MKPPRVLLVCGAPASGKTFLTHRLLSVDYDVATCRVDFLYEDAFKRAGMLPSHGDAYNVSRLATELRTNRRSAESLRVYRSLRARVIEHIERAREWGVVAVFEGQTLGHADEAAMVVAAAHAVGAGKARVDRVHVRPSLEDWQRNRKQKVRRLTRAGRSVAGDPVTDAVGLYEPQMRDPDGVLGLSDYTVTGEAELRSLADGELRLRAHRWYQRFTLGPVTTNGGSDAAEKVDTVDASDVAGRSVLDLCCATGAHAIMLKDRGAARVVGIEMNPARYCKCLEVKKLLLASTKIDAEVEFRLGDAIEALEDMEPFDTVVMFGAMHYFPDYDRVLGLLAAVAGRAVYVEFTFSEKEHDTADHPGAVRPYTRASSGTTIYMADPDALERTITAAMPGFRIDKRVPIAAPGPGLKSSREVWRLVSEA